MIVPVVQGVAPALAGLGKIVRWHARHHPGVTVIVEQEVLRVGPHLGTVVGDEDRRILVQSQDQGVPMTSDSVSPTARVTAPLEGESVPRGGEVRIMAHAWDNSALTRVDYLVNGRTVCSKTDPLPGYGFTSPLYFCWWQVPKRNQTHSIEVRAYDAAGNSNTSRQIFVTSG